MNCSEKSDDVTTQDTTGNRPQSDISGGYRNAILTSGSPPPITVQPVGIPASLKCDPKWVCWRWKNRDGSLSKPPCASDGSLISATDPRNWLSFSEVQQAHERSGIGIGYVLDGSGTICLDCDDCRNPETGEIARWAREIVDTARSYTEVSPSGTGVKIFLRGELPNGFTGTAFPCPDGSEKVEVFASGRYLTVTGDRLPDTPEDVQDRSAALGDICGVLQGWKSPKREERSHLAEIPPESTQDRQALMERARSYLANCPPAIQGSGGDNHTFVMAQHPTRGFLLNEDESFEAMQDWNVRCEPPWEERDLRRKIHEATQAGNAIQLGEHLMESFSDIVNAAVNAAGANPRQVAPARAATSKTNGKKAKMSQTTELILTRASDIQPEKISWLWKNRIPRGKLTLLSGDPGLGKSHISVDIAARVTTGTSWPDGAEPCEIGSVLIFSAEDDPADTIVPRLLRTGADRSRVHFLDSVEVTDSDGNVSNREFNLTHDVQRLEQVADCIGDLRLVIIDPVSSYTGKTDSHKNAEVRGMLAPLADLAARRGFAVLAVTHLNKGGSNKALYRSTGSLAFTAAARAVWMLAKDLEDPERRLLLPVKCNVSREQSGLALRIKNDENGSFVAWESDPVSMTADQYLGAEAASTAGPRRPSEIEKAKEFLQGKLSGDWTPAKDLEEAAKTEGVSEPTLKRARKELGVQSEKGKGGIWQVRLRQDEPLDPVDTLDPVEPLTPPPGSQRRQEAQGYQEAQGDHEDHQVHRGHATRSEAKPARRDLTGEEIDRISKGW